MQKEVDMVKRTETIICDGCGVEITWSPIVVNDRQYCCIDCSQGLPCTCGERMEEEDEYRNSPAAMFESGGKI
jgi:hypothetical protein